MPYPCPIRVCNEDVAHCYQASEALCVVSLFFLCYVDKWYLFLLQEVIVNSGASSGDVAAPRAHSIHGIATSAFFRNCSLSNVLEETSWRSNTVFTSSYLNCVHYIFEGVRSLGLWLQQANV